MKKKKKKKKKKDMCNILKDIIINNYFLKFVILYKKHLIDFNSTHI